MKSGKQRRQEIRAKRRKKAELNQVNTFSDVRLKPLGAVAADHLELQHNNTYGPLPSFYVDRTYVCIDCSSDELWTAKQQKWWYEIAKGDINSIAVRCRRCRSLIRNEKEEQKKHMEEMALRKLHPNQEFFKKK